VYRDEDVKGKEYRYELHFYWNPLVSWDQRHCPVHVCHRTSNQPTAADACSCPPQTQIPIDATGPRVRHTFLLDLLRSGNAPDYVISDAGFGSHAAPDYLASLQLVPTVVITNDPLHILHDYGHGNYSGTLDFSEASRKSAHLLSGGLPTGDLLLAEVNLLLTHLARTLCPYELRFLGRKATAEARRNAANLARRAEKQRQLSILHGGRTDDDYN
jgi:hypothetical protein